MVSDHPVSCIPPGLQLVDPEAEETSSCNRNREQKEEETTDETEETDSDGSVSSVSSVVPAFFPLHTPKSARSRNSKREIHHKLVLREQPPAEEGQRAEQP